MNSLSQNFSTRLLAWYRRRRRDLPWRPPRGGKPNPYFVLLSEVMLQQTQVATATPYFLRFVKRLPTLRHLAAADEALLLRLWQGLGYYSRAQNLLAAARQIVAEHGGEVPADVESLLRLRGVGRYTAGAIASIAFDRRAPIVDGNVARVLCRLDLIASDPRSTRTKVRLWQRAAQILPQRGCGDFNSALMELGATVCTPRSPRCGICPVRLHCEAFAVGMQERIPQPRKSKPTALVQRCTLCVRNNPAGNGDAKWLIEQRPAKGRWAGMWQFVTVAADGQPLLAAARIKANTPRHLGTLQHALTHRRYHFDVYLCEMRGRAGQTDSARRWVRLADLYRYAMPRPHLRIAEMLGKL